jgi:hypothetical protein
MMGRGSERVGLRWGVGMWLEVVRRGGHCVAAGGGGIDREFECRLGGCCMRSCGLSKVHVWAGRTGAGPRRGRRGGSVRGLRGREGRGKWTGPQEGRQRGRRGGAGGQEGRGRRARARRRRAPSRAPCWLVCGCQTLHGLQSLPPLQRYRRPQPRTRAGREERR